MLGCQHGSGGAFGGNGIMNPQGFAQGAVALCGTFVLTGFAVAWLVGSRSAGIENAGAVPIGDRVAPVLAAAAALAETPQATALANAAVGNAVFANSDVATAAEPVTG